ncbi:MAG: rhodanese-like domain-containing protein [Peptococcaceae bacterium]|nr:rhodanese-like domain-containing protein [Peptococcaceae bacterium]
MRKFVVCLLGLVLGVSCGVLSGCNNDTSLSKPGSSGESGSGAVYQKITPERAKEIMDSGEPYILLDVRTDEEYAEKRIDGAVLIPDYEIGVRAVSELPDKSARILVYCRGGRRSANAANELLNMGYTHVYDFGGINDWPYDTVSGS